jgi:hypothetical protein
MHRSTFRHLFTVIGTVVELLRSLPSTGQKSRSDRFKVRQKVGTAFALSSGEGKEGVP